MAAPTTTVVMSSSLKGGRSRDMVTVAVEGESGEPDSGQANGTMGAGARSGRR